MRKMSLGVFLVVVILFAAVQVQAFDGDRKGFMLNLGVGYGQAKFTGTMGSVSAGLESNGFGGDFKLGAGINPQTMIYYSNRTLLYSLEIEDPYSGASMESSTMVNGMSAVGVSYFLEPEAPSVFFTGALGLGVLLDSESSTSESGVGYTVGVGYEFAKNWILEATYMKANIGDEMGVGMDISNLMLTISWFAY